MGLNSKEGWTGVVLLCNDIAVKKYCVPKLNHADGTPKKVIEDSNYIQDFLLLLQLSGCQGEDRKAGAQSWYFFGAHGYKSRVVARYIPSESGDYIYISDL